MTFLEKLKRDKPNAKPSRIVFNHCPYEYGYEEYFECEVDIVECPNECDKCWNREMPDTEPQFSNPVIEKAYNTGLNDAWELANKIICEISADTLDSIFGYSDIACILDKYTPKEALAKMKEYEKAQNKFEIGDVVVDISHHKGIVVGIRYDNKNVDIWEEGYEVPQEVSTKYLTKTGKKVSLASILEQIGE